MLIVVFMLISVSVLPQAVTTEENVEYASKRKQRITVGLGHTHLSNAQDTEGSKTWLLVPSWSMNYDYRVAKAWSVGLQTDLVLQEFVVEESDNRELERDKPWSIVPVGIWKPFKHFSFVAGAGIELEKDRNLGLTGLGVEYGCELPKAWEAGVAVACDNKWGYYNSWGVAFLFSKTF